MAERRGRQPQSIEVTVGVDPSLWRYSNLREGLEANTDLIARLIQSREEKAKANKQEINPSESMTVSESA